MAYFNLQVLGTQAEKRIVVAHITLQDKKISAWVREAIVEKLATEGVYLAEQKPQLAECSHSSVTGSPDATDAEGGQSR